MDVCNDGVRSQFDTLSIDWLVISVTLGDDDHDLVRFVRKSQLAVFGLAVKQIVANYEWFARKLLGLSQKFADFSSVS